YQGVAHDIEIHAKEILRIRQRLNEILVEHTGQSQQRIEQDLDRDFFMSAQEAKDYHLVDSVITHRGDNEDA
ncbi:ATP-dependent Clp protease proteolytic subunit, partial [Acidithiobacillus caldus]